MIILKFVGSFGCMAFAELVLFVLAAILFIEDKEENEAINTTAIHVFMIGLNVLIMTVMHTIIIA